MYLSALIVLIVVCNNLITDHTKLKGEPDLISKIPATIKKNSIAVSHTANSETPSTKQVTSDKRVRFAAPKLVTKSGRPVHIPSRLAVPMNELRLPANIENTLILKNTLLEARLLHYICKETDLDNQISTLWSDSSAILSWIRSDPNLWNTFLCNQVIEDFQYTPLMQWRHCPRTQNPAAHRPRGEFPAELPYLEI
ncbi:hypothetical protein HNY73_016440 [Argiope bruennichi]|uniref:Uncharacterized protein n=1 Tax=Argiope bruennichi TaxID=94029 RepID=A0A8T0EIR7_ARGBR|nr:hypothetical protein HNY73_016440 [Argiope bruennichi]